MPEKSLLFMACDLVGFQYRLGKLVRKLISRGTGIPVSRIVLHFTHSHSTPDTIGIFPNRISNLLTFDVQYPVITHVMRKMIQSGMEAFENATVEACIGYGTTTKIEPNLAIMRRPPYTKIHDPIRFVKIADPAGKLRGIIVNYQAHPTQLPQSNANIHPEYPGMICKGLLEKMDGLEFACYFNGAAGDVTIHGYKGYAVKRKWEGLSHEKAMEYAIQVIEDLGDIFVQYVMDSVDDVPITPLASISGCRRFIFPRVGRIKSIWNRLPFYKTFKQKMKLLLGELKNALRISMFYDLYRFVNGRYLPMLNIVKNGRRTYHQTEIFVYRLNDIYWFSSPGEPFYKYQEALFRKVPSGKSIFSQMNETCGYIYPWSFYVKGGYETFFSFDALFGKYMHDQFANTLTRIQ